MLGQNSEKKIWDRKKQKILSVEIDRTLSFDEHIASLYRKAVKKLSVLPRLSDFMCTNKKRVLMKAFLESKFGYCPLIWCSTAGVSTIILNIGMSNRCELSIKTILVLSKIY